MAFGAPNVIGENSAGTPGLWNSPFTQLWQNDLALQAGTAPIIVSTNTINPESGNTILVTASVLSTNKIQATVLESASTTTAGLRARYDATTLWSAQVDDTGSVTYSAIGSFPLHYFPQDATFGDDVQVNDVLTVIGVTNLGDNAFVEGVLQVGPSTPATVTAQLIGQSATIAQLGLEYDASNYMTATVGSTGGVTFNATGTGAAFTFSDAVTFSAGAVIAASQALTGTVANSTISGFLSVTATTFIGALTGNASTATTLATSRTIWGQSFNGSANVTGALTSVTDITMSGTLTMSSASLAISTSTVNDTNSLTVTQAEASKAATVIVYNNDNTAGDRVIAGCYAKALDGTGAGNYYSGSFHTYGSNYNVAAFRGHTIFSNDAGLGAIIRSIHATTAHIDMLVGSAGTYTDHVAQWTPTGLTMQSGMTIAAQAVTATTVTTSSTILYEAGPNAGINIDIKNTTTGTGASAAFRAFSDGNDSLVLRATSTSHSTYAGASIIDANVAAGLSIYASHGSGNIRLYSRNTLILTLGSATAAFNTTALSGITTLDSAGAHTITNNVNSAVVGLDVKNSTTGTAASTIVRMWSDGNDSLVLRATSTSHSTYAGASVIDANVAAGLSIYASHGSGDIRLYSRNALALTLGASQKALFAGETEIDGAFNHDGTTVGFYGTTPTAQGTAVADASGGVVIDAEARTAINALLARIRSTGLIAT